VFVELIGHFFVSVFVELVVHDEVMDNQFDKHTI